MKIFTHSYQTESLQKGFDFGVGVLLRVNFVDGLTGYADLHPWPELGDSDLTDLLHSLKTPKPLPMAQRAVDFARIDAKARAERVSLFEGLRVPLSHALWLSLDQVTATDVDWLIKRNYTHVKVKISDDIETGTAKLIELMRVARGALSWRIDFNGCLREVEFIRWAKKMYESFGDIIDFVEDPFAYDSRAWSQSFGLPLALDRAGDPIHSSLTGVDVLVVKPDLHDVRFLFEGLSDESVRIVLTNNLGHPLGHAFALWAAADFYKLRPEREQVCGLQGLQYYSRNSWTDQIEYEGPKTLAPEGFGIGFGPLLESLTWKPL